jgi:hypothetical protein
MVVGSPSMKLVPAKIAAVVVVAEVTAAVAVVVAAVAEVTAAAVVAAEAEAADATSPQFPIRKVADFPASC